jgi:predicted NAD-dependent protein-ADP-ribosyltransferase YbiA (DUF1768 family)
MPDNSKWKASAMLFSGRENPVWELAAAQQKAWMILWQQAPLSNLEVEFPSKLGYTGCRLQHNEHSHWQLYDGCVSFYEKETIFSKKDEERQMELFLLDTAPEEVKEILRGQKII